MTRQLTAIVEREGNGYVALCPEVDVASRGNSVAEARQNLEEALALFFETASTEEIERRLRSEVYVTHVEVAVGYAACPREWTGGSSAGASLRSTVALT